MSHNVTHLRLRNGIPVVFINMPGTEVSTSLVLFKVGSRNETARINGISHFLEHLFFKGTERRPTTLDIARELDGIGAEYNAFTSKDYTGYYVKAASRHTTLVNDVLADILFRPLFDAKEIDRERGVIIEEINMYDDNPMATAEELSEQLLFGAHHPLGFRIAGPRENIRRLSRNDILKYRDQFYLANNMVIIVAGNILANASALMRTYFGSVTPHRRRVPAFHRFSLNQSRLRYHVVHKSTAQAHVAFSFPAAASDSRDRFASELLSIILGGNMSSRLFINVRERQGLCYYIRSGITPYADVGAFTIQAGVDVQRIDDATSAICREIHTLRTQGISVEELHKAKEYLQGKLMLQMEDSEHVASWWGRQELFYRTPESPEDYLQHIRAVTIHDIARVAQKMFVEKHANVVVIGPFHARAAARIHKKIILS